MDEPTSSLTPREFEKLAELIKALSARGVAVIYVSHKLDEVFKVASRATILRDGRKVADADLARTTEGHAQRVDAAQRPGILSIAGDRHHHHSRHAGGPLDPRQGMTVLFDPRTVGPRIRMMQRELTPSETRITEVLLRNAADAPLSLRQVAEGAGVSEALVVKTAKRLGFEGYRELRTALTAYKQQPNVDLHQEIEPDDSVETIVRKVFRTSIQALEETLAILNMDAFRQAAELLHGARQRDFYGLGGSAQIARDVSHKFLRIGVRTSVFDDTHMMAMSASLLGPGDVVVAFSHSGRTLAVLDALEIARANRASIIAVTNYESSPLTELSNVVLCSTAQGSYLTSENAAARIAQLNIMDAVFIAVAQMGYKAAEANLAKTMGAVQTKRRS